VLTVSLRAEGHYGLGDVCLSLPAVVSRNGVERVIEATLSESEQEALGDSANVLRDVMAGVEV